MNLPRWASEVRRLHAARYDDGEIDVELVQRRTTSGRYVWTAMVRETVVRGERRRETISIDRDTPDAAMRDLLAELQRRIAARVASLRAELGRLERAQGATLRVVGGGA